MSDITTRVNSQFPWLDFHQQASLFYWLHYEEIPKFYQNFTNFYLRFQLIVVGAVLGDFTGYDYPGTVIYSYLRVEG